MYPFWVQKYSGDVLLWGAATFREQSTDHVSSPDFPISWPAVRRISILKQWQSGKGKPRSRYVVKEYPDLFRGQEVHLFSWYSGIANLIRRVLPKITPVDGMIKHLAQ